MRVLPALLVVCVVAPARADDATALETRGAQLAKDGHYSDAIDAFKEADRLQPRASHACMIALAYTRRELWPQAEVFFEMCHHRGSTGDPLPDWLPQAEKVLADHLATANVAAIDITVLPANAAVKLTLSSFASDETFAPRKLHLAFGQHVITATAPGYETQSKTIAVTGKTPQAIVLELEPVHREPVTPPRPSVNPAPVVTATTTTTTTRSTVPWWIIGAGAALGLAGGAIHVFAFEPVRDDLAKDVADLDRRAYDADSSKFDARRDLVIGLYVAGGVAIITGLVLRQTVFVEHVDVAPRPGGAVVSWTWRTR
jgi:hypothetical protein